MLMNHCRELLVELLHLLALIVDKNSVPIELMLGLLELYLLSLVYLLLGFESFCFLAGLFL